MSGERGGRDLEFTGNGQQLRGYLAVPELGEGPGILVVQEWWGLVDHIRDVCDRFAREGFVALAPDLYGGASTADPDVAERLMLDLEIPRAAGDLQAATTTLLNHEAVNGPKIGVVGFCMGGQLALHAASQDPRVKAVVDFYGIHPKVTLDLSGTDASVLGIFAERDEFVPPAAARKLESELRKAGVRVHVEIVPDVEHAFMNDTRPDVFDAEAAARAWAQSIGFLRAELS